MESTSRQEIECPLRSAARECPNEPALLAPERTFTFRELDSVVTATAAKLEAYRDRRIALLLDSGWFYVVLVLAAIRTGVTACPLSTRLPKVVIEGLLRKVDAAALVTDRGAFESGIDPRTLVVGKRATGAAALNLGRPPTLDLRRPATIVFTSGSTASAKAAQHTIGNHFYSAVGSNLNISVGPGDRWLLSLPLYHVGGLAIVFRCLLGHASVFVPHPEKPNHETISEVTHVSMVATQLRRLLDSGSVPQLSALLLGGSAIPDNLIDEAHRRGLPIHTSYGLTEMASQVSATPPGASREVLKTSGQVLPHREVRMSPSGEILVRGRTRFEGYVDDGGVTRPFDADGWFATGDLGRIGDDGLLFVRGRRDNMFISGGENIVPEEIEAKLTAIEGIVQAVVVPVPDREFGHRPVAFVRTKGTELDPDDLRARLLETLPRFMIPEAFQTWPEAGDHSSLKVDRESLRRKAEMLRGS